MPDTQLNIIANLKDKVTSGIGRIQGTLKKFQNNWLAVSATIAGTFYTLKKVWDTIEFGARMEQQEAAMRNLATSYNTSIGKIMNDLRNAADGTMSTMDMMAKASRAMVLGLDPNQFKKLMEISRASAKAMGQSVDYMFDSIVLGIGRQSKMILDNLGIIVRAEDAYKKYADSIGKTVDKLTDGEKQQAFFNAAMEAGEGIIERVNLKTKTQAENLETIRAQLKEITEQWSMLVAKNTDSSGFAKSIKTVADSIRKINNGDGFIANLLKMKRLLTGQADTKDVLELALGKGKAVELPKIVVKETAEMGSKIKSTWEDIQAAVALGAEKHKQDYESYTKDIERMTDNMLKNMESATGEFFYSAFKGKLDSAKEIFASFADSILREWSNTMARMVINESMSGMKGLIGKGASSSAGWITTALSGLFRGSHQLGTSYIGKSGYAMVHKGEEIRPANKAKENAGGNTFIVNLGVQAMDSQDVFRRRKDIANAVIHEIKSNAQMRGVIKQYG